METKNQKLQELVKKMETLKETEKGQLRGGFMSIPLSKMLDQNFGGNTNNNHNASSGCRCSCSCSENGLS